MKKRGEEEDGTIISLITRERESAIIIISFVIENNAVD
jgi:hypothetical protein